MAKKIMIQGTMSNAGKSLLTAALCRIFHQDGYRVAPFKSQNMALNSYITEDGLEMGRAQVMQAEAAGIAPCVEMNPILLKPSSDTGSQIIVNGEVVSNMSARDYFAYKHTLIPDIMKAFHKLEEEYDIIVIEGAGSPAEINLKQDDIVNMGLAEMVDAPVLLVGDIDRGGVFAQLYGTYALLEKAEQQRIKGLIINKFRGDKTILDPGITMLEERMHIPIVGVAPYMQVDIDDEDGLSERLLNNQVPSAIDIAVIRLPRLSNFTDFRVFESMDDVSLRYISKVSELGNPDMIILPGTKNTMDDLKWLRENGLEAAILKHADRGTLLFGVCGGYQMLGMKVNDPDHVESGGSLRGMGLLNIATIFEEHKTRTRVEGNFQTITGDLSLLSGMKLSGYEIHMGRTEIGDGVSTLLHIQDTIHQGSMKEDGAYLENVYGSYVHGIFDEDGVAETIVNAIAQKKGIIRNQHMQKSMKEYKEEQYNILANTMQEYLDMDKIYEILNDEVNVYES